MSDTPPTTPDSSQPETEAPAAQTPKLRLSKPHHLIVRAMEPPPKPDQYGYTRPDNRPKIELQVSSGQRRNAFAVLDRLFKALEANDITIEVSADYHNRGIYAVRNHYDRATISISEGFRKVEHVPTAKEQRDHEQWRSRIPKWDDQPTGNLTLRPGGPVDLSSEDAVKKLVQKAVADIETELANAKERRQAEERRRHEEYLQQQEEEHEKERVTAFNNAAQSFRQYKLMLEYIEEVRRFGRIPENQRREGQSLEDWIQWAKSRARFMHPLGHHAAASGSELEDL